MCTCRPDDKVKCKLPKRTAPPGKCDFKDCKRDWVIVRHKKVCNTRVVLSRRCIEHREL